MEYIPNNLNNRASVLKKNLLDILNFNKIEKSYNII